MYFSEKNVTLRLHVGDPPGLLTLFVYAISIWIFLVSFNIGEGWFSTSKKVGFFLITFHLLISISKIQPDRRNISFLWFLVRIAILAPQSLHSFRFSFQGIDLSAMIFNFLRSSEFVPLSCSSSRPPWSRSGVRSLSVLADISP